jgi:glyoxylase-like metal-dependent hydrolase (beta-lactamase superfamily II)
MAQQIIPFTEGINTSYIVKDKGVVIFDAIPFKDPVAYRQNLEQWGIDPKKIELIILSHGDFDHVGGTKLLKEMTGAKVAIHEHDRLNLEEGIFHWPEGVTAWGKFSRWLLKPVLKKMWSFSPVPADIILDDNGLSLEEFGIAGKIIFTPGHTFGSVSVVLDSGDALIGCLAHNRPPFVTKPSLPIYAKDIELLKNSWKTVLKQGASTIYPGHGKPFPAEIIHKYIN